MTEHHRQPGYLRISKRLRALYSPQVQAGSAPPCLDCGRPIMPGEQFDISHIIPASMGGADSMENLSISHSSCNRRAGSQLGAMAKNKTSRAARRLPDWGQA